MKIILVIDTSNNKEVVIGLEIDEKKFYKTEPLNTRKAQVVLPVAEALLKKHKLNLYDITELKVNTGPGSFTGLRVGITIANTLGYVLKIPVNGKNVGQAVEAKY